MSSWMYEAAHSHDGNHVFRRMATVVCLRRRGWKAVSAWPKTPLTSPKNQCRTRPFGAEGIGTLLEGTTTAGTSSVSRPRLEIEPTIMMREGTS